MFLAMSFGIARCFALGTLTSEIFSGFPSRRYFSRVYPRVYLFHFDLL